MAAGVTGEDDKQVQVRPFTAILAEMDDGLVAGVLSQELHDLTAQVVDSGRPGKLSLTITLAPIKSSRTGVVEATAKVDVTPPKTDPHTSIFFTDRQGNLSRRDERQLETPPVRLAKSGETA